MKQIRDININTPEYWDTTWANRQPEVTDRFLIVAEVLKRLNINNALDIGCGTGEGWLHIKAIVPKLHYTGTDFSPLAVEAAQHIFPDATWRLCDYKDQPFPEGSFEAVMSQETIEHLEDPEALIAEMKRLATKAVIVTTPYGDSMAGVHEHVWTFNKDDFKNWFNEYNGWRLQFVEMPDPIDAVMIAVATRVDNLVDN